MASRNKSSEENRDDIPDWFARLCVFMLVLILTALWVIPSDYLLKWSMWWNNIHLTP